MFAKNLNQFYIALEEKTKESEHQFLPYGILGFLGFAGFYFFNREYIGQEAYENILVRFIAATLALGLIFNKHWPQKFKKILPIYWNFTLCFNTPFFFTFMFLKNSGNIIWVAHSIGALVVFLLLTDWLSCIFLIVLGVLMAILAYVATTPIPHIPENLSTFLTIYVTMVGHALFASKRNQTANKEKLATMKMLAGAIAHEIRTPLAAISMMSTNLKKSLTRLASSPENKGSAEDAFLATVPERLNATAKNAFTIIDMVLMNLKDVSGQDTNKILSMEYHVNETLSEYPLTDLERSWINLDLKNDFDFKGDPTLFKHILFNLLKNALHYIKAAGKGEITITLKTGKNENLLIFKDTGKGMPESMVPHVFDRFYSRTQHGTGIGLAFCKSVMGKFKGSIYCESILNVHTTFILSFPVVGEGEKALAA